MRSQISESKKSLTDPKASSSPWAWRRSIWAVTRGSFRRRIRRQTRAPRSQRERPRRARRRLPARQRAPWYVRPSDGSKGGQEVERPRDKDGALVARGLARARDGGNRIADRLHDPEERTGALGQLPGRERAR